jgi:hypothetical protein
MTDQEPATPATPATSATAATAAAPAEPAGAAPATPAKLSGAALYAALGAIAVWVVFAVILAFRVGGTETEWTRLTLIFASIQGVAFAAAGALFGTAVQQQTVTGAKQETADARKDAADAKQEAAAAKQDADTQRRTATTGLAFAKMVMADGSIPPDGGPGGAPAGTERFGAGATAESADAVRKRHAELARTLFGDLLD